MEILYNGLTNNAGIVTFTGVPNILQFTGSSTENTKAKYQKHIFQMEENPNLNRIKVALVERQKTSKWLAEQMDKSDTTVSRWVSNKIQPSVEQLFEIARILNMDVKDLLNSNLLNK